MMKDEVVCGARLRRIEVEVVSGSIAFSTEILSGAEPPVRHHTEVSSLVSLCAPDSFSFITLTKQLI